MTAAGMLMLAHLALAGPAQPPPPPSVPDLLPGSGLRGDLTRADFRADGNVEAWRRAIEGELTVASWLKLFARLPTGSVAATDMEDPWEEDVFGNVSGGARVLGAPFAVPITLALSASALFPTADFDGDKRYYGGVPTRMLDDVFMAEHPYDFHHAVAGSELRVDGRWTHARWYAQAGVGAFLLLGQGAPLDGDEPFDRAGRGLDPIPGIPIDPGFGHLRVSVAGGVSVVRSVGAAIEVNELVLRSGHVATAMGASARFTHRWFSAGLQVHRHLHGPFREVLAVGATLQVSTR